MLLIDAISDEHTINKLLVIFESDAATIIAYTENCMVYVHIYMCHKYSGTMMFSLYASFA